VTVAPASANVESVYLFLFDELIDFDCALSLNGDGFKFLGAKFDVLTPWWPHSP
jgi:hypothetical protein